MADIVCEVASLSSSSRFHGGKEEEKFSQGTGQGVQP